MTKENTTFSAYISNMSKQFLPNKKVDGRTLTHHRSLQTVISKATLLLQLNISDFAHIYRYPETMRDSQ